MNKGARRVYQTSEVLAESNGYEVVVGHLIFVENTDYNANTVQGRSGTDISSYILH